MKDQEQKEALAAINLTGLSVGAYEQKYVLDNKLFERFENHEVFDADVTIKVILSISPNVKEANIAINGTLKLTCDRCLQYFTQEVTLSEQVVLKQTTTESAEDLNLINYDSTTGVVLFDQYIYDMIMTSLPIKKTHPDDDKGNPTCNSEMLKLMDEKNDNSHRGTDPRWDQLKNLI